MFLYNKMAKQGHEESIATQQKSLFLPWRCHSVQTPENIDPHFGELGTDGMEGLSLVTILNLAQGHTNTKKYN